MKMENAPVHILVDDREKEGGKVLAALAAHILNAGEHLVQDSGWYSNVGRGKRRKAQGEATTAIVESSERSPSEAKRAWARRSAELATKPSSSNPRSSGRS